MKLLKYCLALAIGEGIVATMPQYSFFWPVLLGLAILTLLFGYGIPVRGWRYGFVLLLGATLFLRSSQDQHITYRVSPWMATARHSERLWVPDAVFRIRKNLARRISLGLEYNHTIASLNRAILLGERRLISPQLKRKFVDSGTIHVFAISGLHVMVIAKTLALLLLFLGLPERVVGAMALPFVWAYVVIVGHPPSAVRAAIMVSVFFLAPVCWRKSDAIHAWSVAFLIMHMINPLLITQVGSQLSFIVMLTLLIVSRLAKRFCSGWKMALLMTFSAWASGVPISAAVFGRITPGGVLANIILVATASYSVAMATLGTVLSCFSETLARHFNNLSALFTGFMVDIAEGVSRLPGASFEVPAWGIWQCLAWYAMMLLAMWLLANAGRKHQAL